MRTGFVLCLILGWAGCGEAGGWSREAGKNPVGPGGRTAVRAEPMTAAVDSLDGRNAALSLNSGVGSLTDGKYTAESSGWTGMSVEVEIRRGKIERIQVLRAKGSTKFSDRVVQSMPGKIVKAGQIEVDDVTGATLSSRSLKEAVRLALEKARSLSSGPGGDVTNRTE